MKNHRAFLLLAGAIMYYLTTESTFDSAHFLADYNGKCRNLHGHQWRVVAKIQGLSLQKEGSSRAMVVDFSDIKKTLKRLCDNLDHSLIYETNSMKPSTIEALKSENFRIIEVPFRPTAENFAKYFYNKMAQEGFNIKSVEVYETPTNCAIYEA